MIKENYDIIIVGAGPAGGECARYISENSSYSLLLLDQTKEIGEPKKSTAGVPEEVMDVFSLPNKIAMSRISSFIFEGPSKRAEFNVKGRVLNFQLLKRFLVEKAVDNGADLSINSRVDRAIMDGKKIEGVEYSFFGKRRKARAKIVIDATGPAAVLSRELKVTKMDNKKHWFGIEFEMEKIKFRKKAFLIKLDNEYAPGGYSWIFSTGRNKGKAGNCWSARSFKHAGGVGSSVDYLLKWIKDDKRLSGGSAVEVHGGDAYVYCKSGFIRDNFMSIGDAASTINPIFGEGIRPAMYSGRFAAETAIDALKKGDSRKKALDGYKKKIESYTKGWKYANLAERIVYQLSNKNIDRLIEKFAGVDDEIINRLIRNEYTLKDINGIIKFNKKANNSS